MDKYIIKFLSFIIAFLFYILIVLFMLEQFFAKKQPKQLQIKAQSVDVYIQTPKKSVPKPVIQKRIPANSGKKRGSASPKKSLAIKNLFAQIQTAVPKKAPKRSSHPSRLKGKGGVKAQELLKKLHLQSASLSHKSIKSVSGEKDPYLQKIYTILYSNWMPSKMSAGNRAKVRITIDTHGNFFYRILEPAASALFNEELQSYLENMSKQHFPPPPKQKEFVVYFVAKE